MEIVMEKIKKTKILALIGIIGLILGTLLPYLKVEVFGYSKSLSLWGYWEGKIIIILAVLNTMFIFKEYVKQYAPQMFNSPFGKWVENANDKMSLIPTLLSAAFAVYLYIELEEVRSFAKYGIGFYVVWASIVCLVAFSFLYKGNGETQTINQMQQPVNPMNPQVPGAAPVQPMAPVTPQAPVVPTQPAPTVVAQNKFCPNCGNQVDANSNQCPVCGSQIQ